MKKLILLTIFGLLAMPGFAAADLVKAYEFSAGAEGWTGNASVAGGVSVSAGLLTGTADATTAAPNGRDPQLLNTGQSIAKGLAETWTTLEFRVRETDDVSGIVTAWSNGGLAATLHDGVGTAQVFNAATFSAGPLDVDNFFTVTVDISGYARATITELRVDPIGGASGPDTTGNSFEVDYIRISDSAVAVPEPTSLGLISIAIVGMVVRRKRRVA